jgi:DNA-binding PadR family transcriptional regulator
MAPKPNQSLQTRAVLSALLEKPLSWRHGYDLSKATGLKSGTLYPLLIRLSDQGLLDSKWEEAEPGRPPRHAYRLTASGKALALSFDAETGTRVAPGGKLAGKPA